MNLLRANKNYRLFFSGVVCSNIGDYMDDIAMAQIVYLTTKSTVITSYVFAIKIICSFFSILTSTIADLGNKKKILSTSCILQAVVILILINLYRAKILTTIALLFIVTFQALFSTFMRPCQNAILPRIVGNNEILEARSLMSLVDQFIQIFSYLCAGLIILKIGLIGALCIDFLSFLIMPIVFCKIDFSDEVATGEKDYFAKMLEGFEFIKEERILKSIMFITFIGNFLVAPVDTLIVALVSERNYSSSSFSVYMAMIAMGGIIAGLLYKTITNFISKKNVLVVGYILGMCSLLLLNISNIWLLFSSGILMGSSAYIVSVMNASLIQMYTPIDKSARIFSIFKCISFLASPIGIILAGAMGDIMGMGVVYNVYGVLMIFTVLGAYMLKEIR